MDQGNPNPEKYYVCYHISPVSEFHTFSEALENFKNICFPFDFMIIEHKRKFFVVGGKNGNINILHNLN